MPVGLHKYASDIRKIFKDRGMSFHKLSHQAIVESYGLYLTPNQVADKFEYFEADARDISGLDQYPNIKKLVESMAASNGIINRNEPVELVYERTLQAIGAEGIFSVDVYMLDDWIGSLSIAEFETLSDGDEDEYTALIVLSPFGIRDRVGELISDIWESITESTEV